MDSSLVNALFAFGGLVVGAVFTYWNTGRINNTSRANATLADATAKENAKRSDETTRTLKLTDHRVAWIQRLRDEMAVLLSWGMTPFSDHVTHRALLESGARIKFLMNADDADYEKLVELVKMLQSALTSHEKQPFADEYVKICQRILKREWETAKRELSNGKSDFSDVRFSRN